LLVVTSREYKWSINPMQTPSIVTHILHDSILEKEYKLNVYFYFDIIGSLFI
jgi:hypothetical protein